MALTLAVAFAESGVRAQDGPPISPEVFHRLSPAEIATRVSTALDRYQGRAELVGLSVAVARGDELIVDRGFGIADLEWQQPADADAIFRIGSLTKQFTAAAIMKLVEAGSMGLDDPIGTYLPEIVEAWRPITLRQLLNHTSGIPNYTARPDFWNKYAPLDLSDTELLNLVSDQPLDFPTGTSWRYSNTNYYLLGMIVEKVSGRSYADYMAAQFFTPLGLAHTSYGATGRIIAHRAHGYAYDAWRDRPINAQPISMKPPGAAGALVSTAGDLVRWQIALGNGRAISKAAFEQLITNTVDMGQNGMRYGFGLMTDSFMGQRRIAHDGGIAGFNSVLIWLPDVGLRVAVISNSEAMPSTSVLTDIIAVLTSDAPLSPLLTEPRLGTEAALRKLIVDQAAGTLDYDSLSPRLATVTRAQSAQLQRILSALGPIRSITFKKVDLDGLDQFRVEFEKGAALFSILLQPDGKIATVAFRPVPPAAAH